jgi:hypothetical protein
VTTKKILHEKSTMLKNHQSSYVSYKWPHKIEQNLGGYVIQQWADLQQKITA